MSLGTIDKHKAEPVLYLPQDLKLCVKQEHKYNDRANTDSKNATHFFLLNQFLALVLLCVVSIMSTAQQAMIRNAGEYSYALSFFKCSFTLLCCFAASDRLRSSTVRLVRLFIKRDWRSVYQRFSLLNQQMPWRLRSRKFNCH